MELSEAYHQLSYYTLNHPEPDRFVHQHIVDAQTAQTATADDRPIGLLYALVGLYLALEKNYTGREVQLAHLELARDKSDFPPLALPADRGEITVTDVLGQPPGPGRDAMITRWCAAVWRAHTVNHVAIVGYCRMRLSSAAAR